MECTLCKKQYIGKIENTSNLRLHKYRKDLNNLNVIFACKHSQNLQNNFNKHGRFIITMNLQLQHDNTTKPQYGKD